MWAGEGGSWGGVLSPAWRLMISVLFVSQKSLKSFGLWGLVKGEHRGQ